MVLIHRNVGHGLADGRLVPLFFQLLLPLRGFGHIGVVDVVLHLVQQGGLLVQQRVLSAGLLNESAVLRVIEDGLGLGQNVAAVTARGIRIVDDP